MTTSTRDELLDVAVRRLGVGGVEALRQFLTPSSLISGSDAASVSRDTAYRTFRSDPIDDPGGAVLVAASERAMRHDIAGVEATLQEVGAAYLAENGSIRDRLNSALEANVAASFDSKGWPIGFLLLTAALTSSRRWAGDRPSDPLTTEVGRQLLEHRREYYEGLTDLYEPLVRRMMADTGLRPSNRTTRQVVKLTHCLIDGAVLRMFFDPDLRAPDVADAIVQFGLSMGEPGSLDDPRRPPDERRADLFDQIVRTAVEVCASSASTEMPDPPTVADAAGIDRAALELLIPSDADLADSMLRFQLVDGGFLTLPDVPTHPALVAPLVIGGLERLSEVADTTPAPFRKLTDGSKPLVGTSMLDDSISAITQLLLESGLDTGRAAELAEILVAAAARGRATLLANSAELAEIRLLQQPSART